MCQYSQHFNSRDAQQGETVNVTQFSHARGFSGKKDASGKDIVCVRDGTGVCFSKASPSFQAQAGVNAPNLRAIYENPNGTSHNDDSQGDGLVFYREDGTAANFVTFNNLQIGQEATIAFTYKDQPVWPESNGETSDQAKPELVAVKAQHSAPTVDRRRYLW